jgi:lipopolysaccharide/colanic/teichoic acid biosynthesis glycosyltransferase
VSYSRILKIIFDLLVSLICAVIALPFCLLLLPILAISFSGAVFYIQDRIGLNGRHFKLIKFKTMNEKRSQSGHLLSDKERITRLGNFLRKSSLDEIPQLLNILKGDMSLVGPRPLLPRYLPLYSTEQSRRHEVRPGITGWAQVNGRNAISWEKKFEYDVWYVDHVSFWLDMKIIFMTIKKVILKEGINAGSEVTMVEFRGSSERKA